MQRSYAEGRNTKHAEDVRKSIIASMIKATTEKEPLFFDFVYGNLDSQNENEKPRFIPFDGQQRLTTLFLFHLYVFEKIDESKEILKNFSYETRSSAKEFIEKLCENKIIPCKESSVSDFITNQNWFFDDWKKDPTISSMLVVLDEIHNQFSELPNTDFKEILYQLKNDCITFHFVDMQKNKLPAQTYVKMNARGKNLTAFENFKASLEEYLEEKDKNLCEILKNNIDIKWLDLFYEKSKPDLPDALIMSFFNRHFINVWTLYKEEAISANNTASNTDFEKVGELSLSPKIDEFTSWNIYKTILENTPLKKSLVPIFNLLKQLCEDKDNSVENNTKPYKTYENWNFFNRDSKETTYPSRVAFYGLLTYFEKENYDANSFSHWMRVIWNIIENSTIDSPDPYLGALKLIDKLSASSNSIYKFLAASEKKINSNFASEQIKEERLKAKKILESKSWEEKILLAERYEILLGKIAVLFQIGENTTETEFENRFNLLKKMHENPDDEYHLAKVLMSYYKEPVPSKMIFLGNNVENIKRLVTNALADEFKKLADDMINPSIKYEWLKDLATTNLLNVSRGQYLKKYGNRVILYGTSGCVWNVFGNDVWGNVILDEVRRKVLLKSLNLPLDDIQTDYKSKDYVFFSGRHTNFKFENHCFQWWTHDNLAECDVYLMTDDWADYKKRKPLLEEDKTLPDENKYFAFNASDDMLKNPNIFANKLRKLIKEAEV